ncbi:ABC transporter permease [Jiulongibacter sediminis]|uniref:ABC transporter permease n=1 Tax=Jiulongibacter sediminis TaxID=1605367 RepID=UPI0026EBB96D|nr:ABC transporter permease [Jiulongibacter sediminis]
MLRHHLLSAYRNLKRNKTFSFINIGGLALGIAAFLFILQYIGIETGVNQFHENADRIYRVINVDKNGESWSELEPGFASRFVENFPEIEAASRKDNGITSGVVQNEENDLSFREADVHYVEGNFFEVFSFPILAGNASGLNEPNTVFISESSALKYFGDSDPINQNLILHNQFGKTIYTVKGVYEDMSYNSDFDMDMAFSLETLKNEANLNGNGWANLNNLDSQFAQTILLLKSNTNVEQLEAKLTAYRESVSREDDGVSFKLQPLTEMHLGASLNDPLPTYGNIKYVYILGAIGLMILLIAWFNYVNLSTANSLKRSVEVGVRKAIGADQKSLLGQFLIQTALVNLIGFLVALVIIILCRPLFNEMIGKDLPLFAHLSPSVWLIGALALLLGTLISGVYAALVSTRFKTVETIKGLAKSGKSGSFLRKSLVVMQFGVSVALIFATVVIYSQLDYLRNKDLGVDSEQMLIIRGPAIYGDNFDSRRNSFLNELASQSMVEKYALSGAVPARFYNFRTNGFTHPGSKPEDKYNSYAFVCTEGEYFDTYGIPLKAGRTFTPEEVRVDWNSNSKVMINETALEYMGFESAQEAMLEGIQWDERHLDIIGVSADYHHLGLQSEIDPIIFYPQQYGQFFSVKLAKGDRKKQLASLGNLYRQYFPGNPFDYSFLEEDFAESLQAEQQYGLVFTTASVLAILIACLGLFGLTMYTVEARIKEIGVRKVLGASVASVVALLSKDFLILVVIALLLATPVTIYLMSNWLSDFPYAIEINGWMVAGVSILALMIAFITVSFQTLKGALMNPGTTLRNE